MEKVGVGERASLPTEVICKLELIIIMFDCAAAAYSKANIADTAIQERARAP